MLFAWIPTKPKNQDTIQVKNSNNNEIQMLFDGTPAKPNNQNLCSSLQPMVYLYILIPIIVQVPNIKNYKILKDT